MNEPAEQALPTDPQPPLPTLFYDGECGLCDRSISFVLARDQAGLFHFAPLQGETAAKTLSAADTANLGSVVLVDEAGTWRHSTAVVRVLWKLHPGWKFAGSLLWLIPRPLRNLGYRLVARVRHRLFPLKATCRMPTADERRRMLP